MQGSWQGRPVSYPTIFVSLQPIILVDTSMCIKNFFDEPLVQGPIHISDLRMYPLVCFLVS